VTYKEMGTTLLNNMKKVINKSTDSGKTKEERKRENGLEQKSKF